MNITILNSIAGSDLPTSIERQQRVGVSLLDLKGGLFGKSVEDLLPADAERIARLLSDTGSTVDCLSSCIGHTDLAQGEPAYAERHLSSLARLLATAAILRPRVIRLLAPRPPAEMPCDTALAQFPWVIDVYRRMTDSIAEAGFPVLIENEAHGCLLQRPQDILDFLGRIDRAAAVRAIYDVQNLWQSGTFPSLQVLMQLAPVLGGLHLKGGRTDGGNSLVWASPLEAASWPVVPMVRATIDLGSVPTICINHSHGKTPAGWNGWDIACQDLQFLREHFSEIPRHGLSA